MAFDYRSLPSNSDKSKKDQQKTEERRKDIAPVIDTPVVRRKQPMGKKFADTFLSESLEDVKSYVIFDVLVPKIKDTFLDMVNEGLNLLFNGDPRSTRKSGGRVTGYSPNKISYQKYYDSPKSTSSSTMASRRRDFYDFEQMIVGSKGEAENIIDHMIDILEQYEVVTVGDLFQLCNLTPEDPDFNYGWTDLSHASTKRVNGGYLLDLPRAKNIR